MVASGIRSKFVVRPITVAGIAAIAAMLGGCGGKVEYAAPPPPEVGVTHPIERTVTEYLEFSGMTQPLETVEIRARVKGFLKERHFTEGAEVKKGQLLLVIDEEPFQIQLEAAETRLAEAEAALKQATVSRSREVAAAQLNQMESQLSFAQQEERRIKGLREQRISTDAELEQTISTRKVREAEVESAKANLEQAQAVYETTILSCRAQVESARIAVRNAALDLSYCRMEAPIDGRISRINVDIGNLVGDGQASVLATIVKMAPVYAYATISELDLLKTPALMQLRRGGDKTQEPVRVELGLADQADYPFAGEIDYTDPALDSGTGTLRLRGVFKNQDRELLPGMFVRMRIPVAERAGALLVPERALATRQSGEYLLIVDQENVARDRPVKTGVSVGDLRVVEGDFTARDQVIVDGLQRANPGSKVTPVMLEKAKDVAVTDVVSGRR